MQNAGVQNTAGNDAYDVFNLTSPNLAHTSTRKIRTAVLDTTSLATSGWQLPKFKEKVRKWRIQRLRVDFRENGISKLIGDYRPHKSAG